MLFWIVAALLTLGACLVVLLPAMRRPAAAAADTDFDLEVYQDQLSELEKDVVRGTIQGAEAEQARVEISRRILKLAGGKRDGGGPRTAHAGRIVATLAVLAVPVASWGIYAATGSPHLPGQPLQARLEANPEEDPIVTLVARAEAHLAASPEDGRGWDVLAPIYHRMGRYGDASIAYGNAVRLLGASAAREAGLGEALAGAAGGMITADAQAAFERALAIEPKNPKARFLLATALAQEGKAAEAAHAWRAMEADLPAESPWRGAVAQALASVEEQPAMPGPSVDEMEAAGSMADNDRSQMIEDMVAGLDTRLRANPQDPEGWQRLLHSYVVLGRREDAGDALARGLEALGRGSEAGEQLVLFAEERGVRLGELGTDSRP